MTKEQLKQLQADLWSAADNLRANSDLKSFEYATPMIGSVTFLDGMYAFDDAAVGVAVKLRIEPSGVMRMFASGQKIYRSK
jgi:hypothetical protein